ncbi:MAG: VF530 family protein [Pseudoalteromonas distincta]
MSRQKLRRVRRVPEQQHADPLHGVTLKVILSTLVERYGWDELGRRITINCFTSDPSINSSLKFLRKTPWAREKVEALYLATLRRDG